MNRSSIRYLMIFLALSAFADDAWAAATTETSDDVLAAENNEYLLVRPTARPAPRVATDLPLFPAAAERTLPTSTEGLKPFCGPENAASLRPHTLLYVFMSLRR
jgi:hypothetical protein